MFCYLAAYVTSVLVMLLLDATWLGVIAQPLYLDGLGHLMAAAPNWLAAGAFYLLYPVGVLYFAVVSQADNRWLRTAWVAALFGFFAYATYDLTNLATLQNWPLRLSLIDITWGTLLTAVSASAGRWVFMKLLPPINR